IDVKLGDINCCNSAFINFQSIHIYRDNRTKTYLKNNNLVEYSLYSHQIQGSISIYFTFFFEFINFARFLRIGLDNSYPRKSFLHKIRKFGELCLYACTALINNLIDEQYNYHDNRYR